MDDKHNGDTNDGCDQDNLRGESPYQAATTCGSGETMCENNQNVDQCPKGRNTKSKKKKASEIIGGGLRHYSMLVCKKIESKGTTTYNEVADEIIAEFTETLTNSNASLHEFDDNIRKRVYDALNVLMALDIITRDTKKIQWKGFWNINARTSELKIAGLRNLILRNQQLFQSVLPGRLSLPFIIVQTAADANVLIEISEDMKVVYFDFNSTPFTLHDESSVLKLMSNSQLLERRCVPHDTSTRPFNSDVSCGGT